MPGQPSTFAARPTPRNADVVAFCPYTDREHLLVCGCYELDDSTTPARRHGRLALLAVGAQSDTLNEVSAIEGVGILDCSWLASSSTSNLPLLAVATSACDGRLHRLREVGDAVELEEACATMPCADAGDACMTLAWGTDASALQLALSGTSGRVYVGQLHGAAGAADGLRMLSSWQAHDLECWAVAFDLTNPMTLYTGADDAQLKTWDLRCALSDAADGAGEDEEPAEPVALASNRRSHQAGVCCISPCPHRPHILATGSYDETARLWDCRMLKAPLGELGCGGGVWRLKWHPTRTDLLLAACMHAGFAVLRTPTGAPEAAEATELEVVARYEAHGTGAALGYGADWSHARVADGGALLAATCSFYDRALHVWHYNDHEQVLSTS